MLTYRLVFSTNQILCQMSKSVFCCSVYFLSNKIAKNCKITKNLHRLIRSSPIEQPYNLAQLRNDTQLEKQKNKEQKKIERSLPK